MALSESYADNVRSWVSEYHKWAKACQEMSAGINPSSPMNNFRARATGVDFLRNLPPTETALNAPAVDFRPASFTRRIAAELIDGIFCLALKVLLLFFLAYLELFDLGDYDKVIDPETNDIVFVDFIVLTQALFPLEVFCKIFCSFLEAFVMAYDIGFLANGQTPGKYCMGIRVIEAFFVHDVTMTSENVRVNGPRPISLKSCLLRSLVKNIVVNGLFPLTTFAFTFPFNRFFYDMMCSTVVVCV
ncbi:unnamed protein product [Caenorhabditis auriculariae]|uniref:RDD domain-containing protein n=1 Tax=Caenorhabditis auriculariae TaxID=2777116 RepID=A0A8S1GVC0_9PELO|nr:unnamed protein product [Caenorhabditis auriculariae]